VLSSTIIRGTQITSLIITRTPEYQGIIGRNALTDLQGHTGPNQDSPEAPHAALDIYNKNIFGERCHLYIYIYIERERDATFIIWNIHLVEMKACFAYECRSSIYIHMILILGV
jgi:hypothetical protein